MQYLIEIIQTEKKTRMKILGKRMLKGDGYMGDDVPVK